MTIRNKDVFEKPSPCLGDNRLDFKSRETHQLDRGKRSKGTHFPVKQPIRERTDVMYFGDCALESALKMTGVAR